eukprot:CAMPEP_0183519878 /NCGR_PEP_ID=MMETSP0371-20130417/16468_1 /TAXON_ID=268820 /ORGANISM="Peridinium aciculiferum, Strain PAER-2" /LENGTH=278 /DNA_ID=CAMNT_0025718119 /DNA_START=134 /DNA_END=972 /DNA_ORIENTATION=-
MRMHPSRKTEMPHLEPTTRLCNYAKRLHARKHPSQTNWHLVVPEAPGVPDRKPGRHLDTAARVQTYPSKTWRCAASSSEKAAQAPSSGVLCQGFSCLARYSMLVDAQDVFKQDRDRSLKLHTAVLAHDYFAEWRFLHVSAAMHAHTAHGIISNGIIGTSPKESMLEGTGLSRVKDRDKRARERSWIVDLLQVQNRTMLADPMHLVDPDLYVERPPDIGRTILLWASAFLMRAFSDATANLAILREVAESEHRLRWRLNLRMTSAQAEAAPTDPMTDGV